MNPPKIGQLITTPQQRDAIHVAVAPVTAGEELEPGERIDVKDNVATKEGIDAGIGIVDPYLRDTVHEGEQFYAFLYPGTITSIRHDWTHPAFRTGTGTQQSEQWLRWFAEHGLGVGYDEMMDRAMDHVEYGEYWVEGGRFYGKRIPEEFWDHFEAVTGKTDPDRNTFVSCSC